MNTYHYTPRSVPSHRPANGKPKHHVPWLLFAGFALALLGLIGSTVWFIQSRGKREPVITTLPEFKRDALTTTAPAIAVEKIFSEDAIQRFNNGDGLETKFVITFRGKEEWVRPFELPRLKMTPDVSRPARREQVLKKIGEFQEIAAEFARYQPRTWTVEVLLDDSEGVNGRLQRQVISEFDDLDLTNRLKAGDGVHLWTFRLSATDFLDSDRALAEQGEGTHAYGKVARKLDDLLVPKASVLKTSLATGLFNALAKNQGKPNRTVLIFSDGLENSPLGDFYHNPPKQAEWKKWAGTLQSKVKCPDLKGAWIWWYGPKTGANADQIRASFSFWRDLLEKAGAHVEMEY